MRKDKLKNNVDYIKKPIKFMEFTISMGEKQRYYTRYENNEDLVPSHKDNVWVATKNGEQVISVSRYSTSINAPRGLPYTLQEFKHLLKYVWSDWGKRHKLRLKAIELKKELRLINKKLAKK
jgi:hypothetical protein